MDISLGLLAGNVGHFFIHNMFFFLGMLQVTFCFK